MKVVVKLVTDSSSFVKWPGQLVYASDSADAGACGERGEVKETHVQFGKGYDHFDKIQLEEAEEEVDPFKALFKGASEDQQRAMMKSFTESNGTVLSMDWEDVKKKTVETQPPDGMEFKNY